MLEKLTAFKDNIWLFSIGCYGLGLMYQSMYYYAFDVPIIYYLSLNDMLLFAVTLIVPVIAVVFLIDVIALESLKAFIIKYIIKREFNEKEESSFYLLCAILLSMIMILVSFFKIAKNNPNLYFFVLVSFMMLSASITRKIDRKQILVPAYVALAGLILGVNSLVGNTKSGISNKEVKFKYENKIVGTRYYSSLSYVGETSNTMFLFDLESQVTFVYEKSKMSNLIYIDKLKSQDWQKNKIKYLELKNAKVKKESDTIDERYVWITTDKKSYTWKSSNTPLGIANIIRQLENILRANGLDIDLPSEDRSTTPDNFNLKENNVALHDAISLGAYEVNRCWAYPSGYIYFRLEKDLYIIQIIYQRVPNLERNIFLN